jgi:hypothetical protein
VSRLQVRARALIVGGWAFVVIGSVGYTMMLVHLGYFSSGQSLAAEGEVVLPLVADTAAVVAWGWLTRLKVGADQLGMVQKAFYAFGVQALFTAASVLASVSAAQASTTSQQLVVVTLVCQAVGSLTVFVGFVVMAGAIAPRRELPREAPREADPSSLVERPEEAAE